MINCLNVKHKRIYVKLLLYHCTRNTCFIRKYLEYIWKCLKILEIFVAKDLKILLLSAGYGRYVGKLKETKLIMRTFNTLPCCIEHYVNQVFPKYLFANRPCHLNTRYAIAMDFKLAETATYGHLREHVISQVIDKDHLWCKASTGRSSDFNFNGK